jgi:polysaccharide biosynthesis transport protein
LEYFDASLKKPSKASSILKLPNLGVLPKILLQARKINLPFITNRLLEIIIQNIELYLTVSKSENNTKTLLFFSTLSKEGKSIVVGNIARKLIKQGKNVLILNYSPDSLHNIEVSQTGYIDTPPPSSIPTPMLSQQKPSFTRLLLGYPDTRIDFESPFLENPQNYLRADKYLTYDFNEHFNSVKNYQDILKQNNFDISYVPDFVLIEFPPILFYHCPPELISNADLPILVCRSNRAWSEADQGALDILMKLTEKKTHFILNGVEPLVIESVLGDLPRKRSWIRRAIKNFFRFQFLTANQL